VKKKITQMSVASQTFHHRLLFPWSLFSELDIHISVHHDRFLIK